MEIIKKIRNNYSKNRAKMEIYHHICSIRENLVYLYTCDNDTKVRYIKNISRQVWHIHCINVISLSGKLKRNEYYKLFKQSMDDEYSNFRLDFEYICDLLGIDFDIYSKIKDNKINECRDIYYSLADAISVAEAYRTDYKEVDKIIERLCEV